MGDIRGGGRTPAVKLDNKLLVAKLRETRAIDFDKIGKLVTELGPQVVNGGDSMTDYVVTVGESFCKLYKWKPGVDVGLEDKAVIRDLPGQLGR